jgi:hypothetical protein
MEPRVNWQLTVGLPGTRTKTRSDFQNWDLNYFSPNPGFHLLGTGTRHRGLRGPPLGGRRRPIWQWLFFGEVVNI